MGSLSTCSKPRSGHNVVTVRPTVGRYCQTTVLERHPVFLAYGLWSLAEDGLTKICLQHVSKSSAILAYCSILFSQDTMPSSFSSLLTNLVRPLLRPLDSVGLMNSEFFCVSSASPVANRKPTWDLTIKTPKPPTLLLLFCLPYFIILNELKTSTCPVTVKITAGKK